MQQVEEELIGLYNQGTQNVHFFSQKNQFWIIKPVAHV